MDKEKENNVLTGNFKSDTESQKKAAVNTPKNQTNPIVKKLFKLTHSQLSNHKEDYKSFSRFNPEDLR